jgi:hypothetical protein
MCLLVIYKIGGKWSSFALMQGKITEQLCEYGHYRQREFVCLRIAGIEKLCACTLQE